MDTLEALNSIRRGVDFLIRQELERLKPENRPQGESNPKDIISTCARLKRLTPADLTGDRQTKDIALARQVAMYLIRKNTTLTFREIGNMFNRNHASVIHGTDNITSDLTLYRQKGIDSRGVVDYIESVADICQVTY